MRWLLRIIGSLVSRTAGAARGGRLSPREQEQVYEAASGREGLRAEQRESGGHRRRTVHVIGPPVSSDGIGWDEELLAYMDEDAVENEVLHRQVKRCSCGSLIGYAKTNVIGTCRICGAVVCDNEGCSARCEYCGSVTCRRHSVTYGEHTFCTRHRARAWWRLFWGRM